MENFEDHWSYLSLGAFFQIGCGGVGVRLTPSSSSWPDYWTQIEEPSINSTPVVIGAAVIAATAVVAVTFAYFKTKHDRIRYALTPDGERVRILTHAEAPEDAVFLADIHAGPHSQLDYVKNDLRNQTALLGGDLVVLDDIQQDIYEGRTQGYRGIGRAYKAKDCPQPAMASAPKARSR